MTSVTKLYGLVLAGGKSERMGRDKGLIEYHGLPQRDYLYRLLDQYCDKTYLSLRADQVSEVAEACNFIVDANEYRGPYNGLQSAHNEDKNVAWLVIACDLPLLDKKAIEDLIAQRDEEVHATAYAVSGSHLPEPLCAIWEPGSFEEAVAFYNSRESSCPRKFLLNTKIKLIHPYKDDVLLNANSLEEFKKAAKEINK